MSDFFRIHAPAELLPKTLRELAVMIHEAEESGDDITFLECWDELERRSTRFGLQQKVIFMDIYREEWGKRYDQKTRT